MGGWVQHTFLCTDAMAAARFLQRLLAMCVDTVGYAPGNNLRATTLLDSYAGSTRASSSAAFGARPPPPSSSRAASAPWFAAPRGDAEELRQLLRLCCQGGWATAAEMEELRALQAGGSEETLRGLEETEAALNDRLVVVRMPLCRGYPRCAAEDLGWWAGQQRRGAKKPACRNAEFNIS